MWRHPRGARAAEDLLSVEAWGRLPEGLVCALRTGVLRAEHQESLALVAEVADRDEVLGGELRRVVQRFENEILLPPRPRANRPP